MDKKKMILAGGLGLAAIVVFMQVKKMGTPPPVAVVKSAPVVEAVQYVDVLVATEDIQFGTRLRQESLQWKQWPATAYSEEYISSDKRPDAITNISGNVVRIPIYMGEPVTDKKLVRPGDKGLMAALLKPGMRAVTTRISVDTAAGGFIQPGDRVDIILITDVPQTIQIQGQKQNNYVANTVFENVHVLAIDQNYTMNPEGGAAVLGSTATFEMTQSDAELLSQIVAEGDISLTLRGIEEARGFAASSATINRDSGGVSTLTVYRGGQPQQVAIKGK